MTQPKAYTFPFERLSWTDPPLQPRPKAKTATEWKHRSSAYTMMITPQSRGVRIILMDGDETSILRDLPMKDESTFTPIMSYDENKILLRYPWPINSPSRTEERIQMRFHDLVSTRQIAVILDRYFSSPGTRSVTKASSPAVNRAIPSPAMQDTFSASLKRQRNHAFAESQSRRKEPPVPESRQSRQGPSLSISPRPASPVQKPRTTEDDELSGHTVRPRPHSTDINTDINELRAPWATSRPANESQSAIPEHNVSQRPASPSMTTAVRQFQYETLHPTSQPPMSPRSPLIDLTAPSQVLLPLSKETFQDTSRSPRPEEADRLDEQCPPIAADDGVANSRQSTTQRQWNGPQDDGIASLLDGVADYHMARTNIIGHLYQPGIPTQPGWSISNNGAYNWSDEELELQIDQILGERGFCHLAERVASILTKRSIHQELAQSSDLCTTAAFPPLGQQIQPSLGIETHYRQNAEVVNQTIFQPFDNHDAYPGRTEPVYGPTSGSAPFGDSYDEDYLLDDLSFEAQLNSTWEI